jgi:hypothetical protein
MYGISSQSKEQIDKVVGDLFDKAALRFLGNLPKLQHKKTMLIGFEQSINLANLFVQSMDNKWLNNIENDVLKGILSGAASYIEILKNKTSNNIIQRIEGLAREARVGNEKIPETEINKVIEDELGKARSGLETIAASESTKARNLGMTLDITRAAAVDGDKDPVIGFAGIYDDRTCKECKRLFLMPDEVTPRLWYISECSAGYFKRGDAVPSILGLHPFCRHTPFMIPSDWGFNESGYLTFIGIGHNALEEQRKI